MPSCSPPLANLSLAQIVDVYAFANHVRLLLERRCVAPLTDIERGVQRVSADGLQAIAMALGCTAAELYALAEGKTLGKASSGAGLEPADLEKDAVQMRRYFRRLRPEYQKLALELVKTLTRAQQKS